MLFLLEFINILLTITVLGVIFSREFAINEIIYWSKIAGLSVISHEVMHKVVAEVLGYSTYYEVFYPGLLIGLLFKVLKSPFVFFIPGYVEIYGYIDYLHFIIISLAGPVSNGVITVLGWLFYKKTNRIEYRHLYRINFLLFILNMLPIPPLDGFKVVYGVYKVLVEVG